MPSHGSFLSYHREILVGVLLLGVIATALSLGISPPAESGTSALSPHTEIEAGSLGIDPSNSTETGETPGRTSTKSPTMAPRSANTTTVRPLEVWNRHYTQFGYSKIEAIQSAHGNGYVVGGVAGEPDSAWLGRIHSNGTLAWSRTYGPESWATHVLDIVRTTDGGYLLLGYVDHNEARVSYFDVWLAKVNATGAEEWNRSYGAKKHQMGTSLTKTPDGGYVFLAKKDLYSISKGPAWLVRVNDTGAVVWNRTYPTAFNWPTTVIPEPTGGFTIFGDVDVKTKTDFSSGMPLITTVSDAKAIRIAPNGSIVWSRTYGKDGNISEGVESATGRPDGGYLVAGWQNHTAWVLALDEAGTERWNRSYPVRDRNVAMAIDTTESGGFALSGTSSRYIEEHSVHFQDAWVAKMNASGDEIWNRSPGGDDHDAANAVLAHNDTVVFGGEQKWFTEEGQKPPHEWNKSKRLVIIRTWAVKYRETRGRVGSIRLFDVDSSGAIETRELLLAIEEWRKGTLSTPDVLELIDAWTGNEN